MIQEESDTSTEEDDEWVKDENVFVPATANSQVPEGNPQGVQTHSSQPSTSDQILHHGQDPRVHVDVPATVNFQVSVSNPEYVQTPSSQPSTSDQTLKQWQSDYGTYANLINETTDDDDDDDLYNAIIASIEEKT